MTPKNPSSADQPRPLDRKMAEAMAREAGARKISVARLSILSNSFLILLKVVVGSLSGSVSIVADALHSGADLLAALVAFFTVRQSHKPPDQDHPYGHGKFENVSGVVEALLILPASGWIAVEAIQKLRHGGELSHVYLGIGLMAFSAVLNWGVSSKLHRVARETESPALEADAVHLQTDIYSSLAVVFGLGLVRLTGVQAMDPLLALVVATMMVKMAWDLMKPSVEVLVDRGLPEEEVRRVEEVLRRDERILGFHQLRTRRSGGTRLVDVHVQLDDDLSLRAAHRVTEEVEDEIRRELPNTQVMVHTEPYREELRHQEEYHGRSGSF